MSGDERVSALKAMLGAMPGAAVGPVPGRRGAKAEALLYKVKGKVYAILSVRPTAAVGLKCDPHLAEILRAQYAGVGLYRHWLRNWISVTLDADVPQEEIERLAAGSYEVVRAELTGKQRAELAALAGSDPPA
jgi:predicted DNA-binding protein (MmcQ/YjbR family)